MKVARFLAFILMAGSFTFVSCSDDDDKNNKAVSLNVIEGESIEYTIDGEKKTISLGEHWDSIREKLGEPESVGETWANYLGTALDFNSSRYLTSGTIFPFNVTTDGYTVGSASTSMGISMGDDRSKVYEIYGTNFLVVAGENERWPEHGVRFGYDDSDKVEYIWLTSKTSK